MKENLLYFRDRLWIWFVERAKGPHALFWLGVCAFLDPIFFPIAPELYLGALMLAHKERWKHYAVVTIVASTLGAALGYFIASFVFYQIGGPIITFFGLEQAFLFARAQLGGHVFLTMLLVPFTVVPEKVFVLAAGFLKAPFLLFMLGFILGRSARILVISYLVYRFGNRVLELVGRYLLLFTLFILALGTIYGMVHWHLVPWF